MCVNAHKHHIYLNRVTPFTTINCAGKYLYRMCSTWCVTIMEPTLFQIIKLFSSLQLSDQQNFNTFVKCSTMLAHFFNAVKLNCIFIYPIYETLAQFNNAFQKIQGIVLSTVNVCRFPF